MSVYDVPSPLCTDCGRPIRPIVSVDIDGTIADYHQHFLKFAMVWMGYAPDSLDYLLKYDGSTDLATYTGVDKRTYRQIKLAYRQGGMKRSMPLMTGAKELFRKLNDLNVEIWMTTTRPYLQVGNVDDDTREWLRRNGIHYDHLLYSDQKYAELVKQVFSNRIACVLEDQIPEYTEALTLDLPALLVRSPYNKGAIAQTYDSSFSIVDGLDEATEIIEKLVTRWREQNGV